MTLPPVSLIGAAAHSQELDSDVEHYSEPTTPTQPMEEEGEVSDWESTRPEQDLDQEVSEGQTYWETIRGVRSFIGWKSSSLPDDNSFAGTRTQPTGKVSVKLTSDEWLCRKMEKQHYCHRRLPFTSSEISGVARVHEDLRH